MAFLELANVTKTYRKGGSEIAPLRDVTLAIEQGEFFVLLGPSGSGKTTLLNLLAGIDKPDSGVVRVGGVDVASLARARLADWRAENVGYVFQQHHLVPVLTAYENVELPLFLFPLSAADRHRRVALALEAVGLTDRASHRPKQLSAVSSASRSRARSSRRSAAARPRRADRRPRFESASGVLTLRTASIASVQKTIVM
jgi:putative ABC transport system ATP-binding protein